MSTFGLHAHTITNHTHKTENILTDTVTKLLETDLPPTVCVSLFIYIYKHIFIHVCLHTHIYVYIYTYEFTKIKRRGSYPGDAITQVLNALVLPNI